MLGHVKHRQCLSAGEVAGALSEDEQAVIGQAEEAAAASPTEPTPSTAEENATSLTSELTPSRPVLNTEEDASLPEFAASFSPSSAEEHAPSPVTESTPPSTLTNTEEDGNTSPLEPTPSLAPSNAEEQGPPTAEPDLFSPAEETVDASPVLLHPVHPLTNLAETPASEVDTVESIDDDDDTGHIVSIHEPTSRSDISLNVQVSPVQLPLRMQHVNCPVPLIAAHQCWMVYVVSAIVLCTWRGQVTTNENIVEQHTHSRPCEALRLLTSDRPCPNAEFKT